jgi:hypothetical protein
MKAQKQRLLNMAGTLGFLMGLALPMAAQWVPLGPPWVNARPVVAHSVALSHAWQVHVAIVEAGGGLRVSSFDGVNWLALDSSGLPTANVHSCDLAFHPNGNALLAIGPDLRLLEYNNGWVEDSTVPASAQVADVRLGVVAGRIWLAGTASAASDSVFVGWRSPLQAWEWLPRLPGSLRDLAFDDAGMPVVLLENATALQILDGGGHWQAAPPFLFPSQQYLQFAALNDGSGLAGYALRRNSQGLLSIDRLANEVWSVAGDTNIVSGDAFDLAVSLSGIPHLVAADVATMAPPQAFALDGQTWQWVGGQFVSNAAASLLHWAFDPTARYVLFRDDDTNGQASVAHWGPPTARGDDILPSEIAIFPNPAVGPITLQVNRRIGPSWVEMYDLWGRLCLSQSLPPGQSWQLDVAHLPQGTYVTVLRSQQFVRISGYFSKIH